jgi:hypothetical protein
MHGRVPSPVRSLPRRRGEGVARVRSGVVSLPDRPFDLTHTPLREFQRWVGRPGGDQPARRFAAITISISSRTLSAPMSPR